jgi:amino acid transporter
MSGWLILLDYLLIPAFIYVGMSITLNLLVPSVGRTEWIIGLVAFTFAVNWFGLKSTTGVSMASVVIQVVMLVGFVTAALVLVLRRDALDLTPLYHTPLNINAVLAGTSICVMAFLGFDAVSTLAEDAKDPTGRTVGRAILAVLGLAGVMFVITTFVLGNLMKGMRFPRIETAAFDLTVEVCGMTVAIILTWVSAIVVGLTNALPMQVGVARLLYAMGRDRQLPAFLARLHPRYNTPHWAMIVASMVSLVVALWMRDHLDRLATLVNFGALVGFVMLHLCVLVHFHKKPESRRWGAHVISPVIGVVAVIAILFGMNGKALALGCAWLVVGVIYWALSVRHATGAEVSEQREAAP